MIPELFFQDPYHRQEYTLFYERSVHIETGPLPFGNHADIY